MNKISSISPLINIFYLCFLSGFGFVSTTLYLGCSVDYTLVTTFILIVFGIYTLNRFTDKEDLINYPEKRIFFESHSYLLSFSIVLIALSSIVLLIVAKFTPFHFILILSGVIYSVKLIPTISKNGGMKFFRIKDIVFIKSVVIALLWGSVFFAINWFLYPDRIVYRREILFIIISWTLANFVNTIFSDIVDYKGDAATGVKTIPVLLGIRKTVRNVIVIPSLVWFMCVAYFCFSGVIQPHLGLFLLVMLLYPIFYASMYKYFKLSDGVLEMLIESDILVFSSGLLIIYFVN